MPYLEDNKSVISYTPKHGIRIKYDVDGKRYTYIPDILVEWEDGKKVIEEIKGFIREPEKFHKKCECAEEYAIMNEMKYRVIFKENLFNE